MNATMNARLLDSIWLVLLAATGVTWFVGESGAAGAAAVAVILGLALVKGWLVIREFMALKQASIRWRLAVVGWLALVLGLIAFTYWKAMP